VWVDYSPYVLGLRLNLFVAAGHTVAGLVWFVRTQRRDRAPHGFDQADQVDRADGASRCVGTVSSAVGAERQEP